MAEQTIPLGSPESTSNRIRFTLYTRNPREDVELAADFAPSGEERWLQYFEAFTSGFSLSSFHGRVSLLLGDSATAEQQQGQDFRESVESGATFTLRSSSGTEVEFVAPNSPSASAQDDGEEYFWQPGADTLFDAIVNAHTSGTTYDLVIDDGISGTPPGFPSPSGDDISGVVGTAIADVTVPEATGTPTPMYAPVGALPGGITFDDATRVISGTPNAVGSGTITIRATNSAGTADYTYAYAFSAAPVLTAPSFLSDAGAPVTAFTGDTVRLTVPEATGNPAPAYAAQGALPAGATFDAASRLLTFKPSATGSGTVTIRASNSEGNDDWTIDYTFTDPEPAYNEGLTVTVGDEVTQLLRGRFSLRRSLSDGSEANFVVRDVPQALAHVVREATVRVTDDASSVLLFSGHILTADQVSIGVDLVQIDVSASGIEQHVFRRRLSTASAREVEGADAASDQLDELVSVLDSNYSAGSIGSGVNRIVGAGPGIAAGDLLRRFGDIQRVNPDGSIDVLTRAELVSLTQLDAADVERDRSDYRVNLEATVGRVLARGEGVRFVASGTMERTTENGMALTVATVTTPANIEITDVSRVVARADVTGEFDEGDELTGRWSLRRDRFEWGGNLAAGSSSVPVGVHGVWRTELEAVATAPGALAADVVLEVPSTDATVIQESANRELRRASDPVELLELMVRFAAEVPLLRPGDAVTVSQALQEELDVYQPSEADVWLVHELELTQVAPTQATVMLGLSRRLPDTRDRDYWGRSGGGVPLGDAQAIASGDMGPPQIALVIPDQQVRLGTASIIDLSSYFDDPDGDMLTYAASSSDTGIVTTMISGSDLSLAPVSLGSATVTVTASDPGSNAAAQSFPVAVVANRTPTLEAALPNLLTYVGHDSDFTADLNTFFVDPDGDALAFTASSDDTAVATVEMSGDRLRISGVADGDATITVRATDSFGLYVETTFEATVETPPPAPGTPTNPLIDGITESWWRGLFDGASNATSYLIELYQRTDQNDPWVLVSQISRTNDGRFQVFESLPLQTGLNFFRMRIRAMNGPTPGPWSVWTTASLSHQ